MAKIARDGVTIITLNWHQHSRRRNPPDKKPTVAASPIVVVTGCYSPPSTTPRGRDQSIKARPAPPPSSRPPSQRVATIAANAKITLRKGGRVPIVDSRPGSMVKSRRPAPSWSPPTSEKARELHQMRAHYMFKLALIAAGKPMGAEGPVAEDFVKREPPYDPFTNPTGVEMWKNFAIYRGQAKYGNGSLMLPPHKFAVAHTPTLTWSLYAFLPTERWIKKQKKCQFNFPAQFSRRAGLSVGNHFSGSPVLVDGKLAFKIMHIKSKRSKIIPLGEVVTQGRFTYYFPNGFDKPGQETAEIWTQARWDAGEYAEGEELADVLDEFIFPPEEMEVIQRPC